MFVRGSRVFSNPVTYVGIMCVVFVFSMYMKECRKALKSERAQRLNMADLYDKNIVPLEKLYNLRRYA